VVAVHCVLLVEPSHVGSVVLISSSFVFILSVDIHDVDLADRHNGWLHGSKSKKGCDIGGPKELGVIYFPAKWGAKEPQNLPKHRVVRDDDLYFWCI